MLLLRHTKVDVRLRDEKGLQRLRAWCNLIPPPPYRPAVDMGGNPSGNPAVLTTPAAMARSDDEVNATSGDAPRRHQAAGGPVYLHLGARAMIRQYR
jgi:hypothetical protein